MKKHLETIRMLSKFSFQIFLLQCVFMSALFANEGNAQIKSVNEVTITLKEHQKTIVHILGKIESQTDFVFVYSSEDFNTSQLLDLEIKNKSVAEALRSISRQANVKFKQVNQNIGIQKLPDLASGKGEVLEVILEQVTVTGRVTDESGEGLPGATILEKGTSNGTITDVDGNYQLSVSESATLLVSFVGYRSMELPVDSRSTVNIQLQLDSEQLEEVVVIGYGTQKKSDLTGAISSISGEKMNEVPATSLDQAIIGRAAGVQITQTSGQPGGAISIRIRGGNSISAGNEPLYVVDGVPIGNSEDAMNAGVTAGGSQNALSMLDPKDIKSIEILKDASATAIYGSRGANGVVLITTKMGNRNQNNVSFDMNYGFQEVRKKYPVLDAQEYARFVNEAERNGDIYLQDLADPGEYSIYTEEQIAAMGKGTDWQDEIFRVAPRRDYKLTFSGGNEDTRYLISASYLDQDGIIINSDFKRAQLRVNLEKDILPGLTVGNNLAISQSWSNQTYADQGFNVGNASSIVLVALGFNPVLPVIDPQTGEYTFRNTHVNEGGGNVQAAVPFYNPVAYVDLAKNESNSGRILGRMFGEYTIVEGLKLRSSLGYDLLNNKQNQFVPRTIALAAGQGGTVQVGTVQNFSFISENTLTYNKAVGNHNMDFLAGFTSQKYQQERLSASAANFSTDATSFNNIGAGETQFPSSNGAYGWSLLSYIGRINYKFMDRYLLTLTARADGSSRFGAGNRYGFFPSGALAWRVSEEPFMQDQNVVSSLKLRTSFGVTGNQELPSYQSLALLDEVRTVFGSSTAVGYRPIRVENEDLKWETTNQLDLGLEFGVLKDRLFFVTDFYYKKTTDLLLQVFLPSSSGFSSAFQNIGSIENKGIELSIEGEILTGELTWTAGFNIAFNRNKVLDLGLEKERFLNVPSFHSASQPVSVLREGMPLSNFYGYKSDGFFDSQAEIDASPDQTAVTGVRMIPGTAKFVDTNGDGVVDVDDRVVLGDANPDFSGGFSTTMSYKGLSLSAIMSYSYGNEVYNANAQWLEFGNGRQNSTGAYRNRWSPYKSEVENANAEAPIAINPNAVNPFRAYDRWVEDGSYLRLNNIILSYNLPIDKMGWQISTFRVFVSGQNLWTLTNYTGFDPEVNRFGQNNIYRGFDVNTYPSSKSYTLGLSIGI
ncbi:MAG: TonB-dependent receptor [Cyclobacteriaceae bacterium]|nr:TonB-dependent receptor [Cyclobacteriaceae bacterium SS2]